MKRLTLALLFLTLPFPLMAEETVILSENAAANLSLETEEAAETTFETTLFALGCIEALPQNIATLSSRIAGRVTEVRANPGDTVERGAILVMVESRQPGDPPPRVPLSAPISGLISSSSTRLGQPVEPETALLEIADLSEVDVIARIPEHRVGSLPPGAEARIRINALPGEVFTARLVRFGTKVDEQSGTLDAHFRLANPDGRFRPGMRTEGAVILSSREGVTSVPKVSVQGEPGGERYVFVRHFELPNAFVKTPVILGESNDERVEIKSGLFPADEVVTQGSYLLSQAQGGGGISLKEALDAAHGHEHAPDGSELTDEKRREMAAGGEEGHGHKENTASPLWKYLSGALALLWLATLASRFVTRREEAC